QTCNGFAGNTPNKTQTVPHPSRLSSLGSKSIAALLECLGDSAEVLAVVNGNILLELSRQSGAISSSESASAVWGAAVHLVHVEQERSAVAERNEDHAVVGELGDEGQRSG